MLVGALGMDLGIARAADAEIAVLLELAHKVYRMAIVPVAAVTRRELRRQVAAQCHHVFDARRLHLGDALLHRVAGGGDAGEVCQRRHAVELFDIFRDVQRVAAGAAARAVGHAHKRGAQAGDLLCCGTHAVKSGITLLKN